MLTPDGSLCKEDLYRLPMGRHFHDKSATILTARFPIEVPGLIIYTSRSHQQGGPKRLRPIFPVCHQSFPKSPSVMVSVDVHHVAERYAVQEEGEA